MYAIDNSAEQLATARRLAAEHGVDDVEWVHGNAESVPQPDASFDFAISEYGAAIWCDPQVWIPEAHRLLRPGGRLVFLGNHPFAMVCTAADGGSPVGTTLERSYFGLGRLDWTEAAEDPGGIEFNIEISSWMRLFRRRRLRRGGVPRDPGAGLGRGHRVLGAGPVGETFPCRTGMGSRQTLSRRCRLRQPTGTAYTTMFSR